MVVDFSCVLLSQQSVMTPGRFMHMIAEPVWPNSVLRGSAGQGGGNKITFFILLLSVVGERRGQFCPLPSAPSKCRGNKLSKSLERLLGEGEM